jgi:hypothetical protein
VMLVVAGAEELREARSPVWGTGGWDPPETREARDWLCLGRLCGWEVRVAGDATAPASHVVVWTGERPAEPELARVEREPLLGVVRSTGPAFAGRDLRGAQRSWRCVEPVSACEPAARDGAPVATLDGRPIARVRTLGRGAILTLGFHPSAARDADGAFTALLRELLVREARTPLTALDWAGTLVLRMDDPGSPESAYREGWRYPKLGREAWRRIGTELRARDARLSVAYVPAFVDDGDEVRGSLEVAGAPVARQAGAIHSSRAVRYRAGALVWDGADEYAGIAEQRDAGTVEVELHGHTHMHPDRSAWAAAADRYASVDWFRELVVSNGADPLARGLAELEAGFATRPRALVCPGDAWTQDALVRALGLGLDLVSSYYLALRDADRWVWCQHVCAPYLDTAQPRWFAGELPVIGYFHDMEPSLRGVDWLTEHLDAWIAAGARRIIDLRTLAAELGPQFSGDPGRERDPRA